MKWIQTLVRKLGSLPVPVNGIASEQNLLREESLESRFYKSTQLLGFLMDVKLVIPTPSSQGISVKISKVLPVPGT